ncbi:hypothetical protein [Corynebacterium macginleyi]|uniref:hypothetical protein n=1 Tax=Corynebacterium macginleyi TaxID=38290 RepID=UPI00190C1D66|nr:hypothetical protein [Corynebacterium macginleyi]
MRSEIPKLCRHIYAVRTADIAVNRKLTETALSASSYLRKSPPIMQAGKIVRNELEDFIKGS